MIEHVNLILLEAKKAGYVDLIRNSMIAPSYKTAGYVRASLVPL